MPSSKTTVTNEFMQIKNNIPAIIGDVVLYVECQNGIYGTPNLNWELSGAQVLL